MKLVDQDWFCLFQIFNANWHSDSHYETSLLGYYGLSPFIISTSLTSLLFDYWQVKDESTLAEIDEDSYQKLRQDRKGFIEYGNTDEDGVDDGVDDDGTETLVW